MTRMRNVQIDIEGMSCASCASAIEKALSRVNGIEKAGVNLGSEKADVYYDADKSNLSELEEAVQNAGYNVRNEKVVVNIGGMSCAHCVKTLTRALKQLDGISSVKINLGTEKAYITYNSGLTGTSQMKQSIEQTGYQYLGIEQEQTQDAAQKEKQADLRKKRNRFIIGLAVGIPLFVLMYVPVKMPIPLSYLMLIISAPVFIYISRPIFKAGWRALKNKNLNMDVMYSMGIGVAYVSSLLGTFEIVLSGEFLFYETAVLLASFLTMGRYLEAKAKGKTSEAIKKLAGLQPRTAIVIREQGPDGGKEAEIPISDVRLNDLFLVKPGSKIPVDGSVTEGESYVDESMFTGEPVPALRKKGDDIIGGTINKNSVLKAKATRIGKDTVLSQIIQLVKEAQASRPPIQTIADKAVSYFIPAVLSIAIITFISWYFISGSSLLFALTCLISVIVIACPCALGLATPTAVTVGLGRGAELGILIKAGEALEISSKINTVVFDKTGTLTRGKPEVTDVVGFGTDENTVLRFAASVENNSQHPLAQSIVQKAKQKDIKIESSEKFDTFGGKGVKAMVSQSEILIGNIALLKEQNISCPDEIEQKRLELADQGKTVALVVKDSQICGAVALADMPKESAKSAVEELKKTGLDIIMITGDSEKTAKAIAGQLGIDSVLAEVLPKEKAQEVKRLQEKGRIVAFVGDGINDAPALSQADVGIALGSGTDVAIESGEIVLVKDRLMDVVAAMQLSKKVMSKIKQNLFWAFAYNTALIPLAAGLLYPFFGLTFKPEFAGLAMALSSATIVSLSLLLRKYMPPAKMGETQNETA